MALQDNKIQASDLEGLGATSMPDKPSEEGMSAAEIKATFDELVTSLVKEKFNALIDELLSTAGAGQIGATSISGITGNTVQAQMESIVDQMTDMSQGSVVDGAITDEKLSQSPDALLARFENHTEDTMCHLQMAGTMGGTAAALSASVPGFDVSKYAYFAAKAHVNASAGATLAVGGSGACRVFTMNGASIQAGDILANGMYLFLYEPNATASARTFYLMNPSETSNHTHTIAQIANLQTTLNGKAASSHTHTIANITNLQSTLNGKAASGHTHTSFANPVELSHCNLQPKICGLGSMYYTNDSGRPSGAPRGMLWLQTE